MKSAYELAMERFRDPDEDSAAKLTDEQKEQLRDIDERYTAKIAEKEVFLRGQIAAARVSGKLTDVEQLEKQLRNERTRLEEEREAKKNRIRSGTQG